jgi:DNA repair exonuclease SbcCD ATPase subunit
MFNPCFVTGADMYGDDESLEAQISRFTNAVKRMQDAVSQEEAQLVPLRNEILKLTILLKLCWLMDKLLNKRMLRWLKDKLTILRNLPQREQELKEKWEDAYSRYVELLRFLHQLEDELEYWEELNDEQRSSFEQMLKEVDAQLDLLDRWLLDHFVWGE